MITSGNVVELTESTAYVRFPPETYRPARNKYLQDIAQEAVKNMTGPVKSLWSLLDALGKAVSDGRIAVWSSTPDDQGLHGETPLPHVVPNAPANCEAAVINDLGGNKLDYHLKRDNEYAADDCSGPMRTSTVFMQLASTVPRRPTRVPRSVERPHQWRTRQGAERDDGDVSSPDLNAGRGTQERACQWPTGSLYSAAQNSAIRHARYRWPYRPKNQGARKSPLRTDIIGCASSSGSAVSRYRYSYGSGTGVPLKNQRRLYLANVVRHGVFAGDRNASRNRVATSVLDSFDVKVGGEGGQ